MTATGRRALVFGGAGYLGGEVVRALAGAQVPTVFTFHRSKERAMELATELGQRAEPLDLRDTSAIGALIGQLDSEGALPDIFIHAAMVAGAHRLAEVSDDLWDRTLSINVRSACAALRALAPRLGKKGGDVIFTATLDGTHPVPAPAHFAASQGALVGMTGALAKELGPQNIRVNLVVMGVLEGGVARDLDPARVADYKKYSAFSRLGSAKEVARAILRLALDNRWMTGSVLPLTGGI